jgi:hypothetical protein
MLSCIHLFKKCVKMNVSWAHFCFNFFVSKKFDSRINYLSASPFVPGQTKFNVIKNSYYTIKIILIWWINILNKMLKNANKRCNMILYVYCSWSEYLLSNSIVFFHYKLNLIKLSHRIAEKADSGSIFSDFVITIF